MLKQDGDFLLCAEDKPIKVRRRTDDPPPKIDLIYAGEIANAIKIVLKHQFATQPEALITQTSRLLGFTITNAQTYEHIQKILQELIEKGELHILQNGMVDLKERTI